MKCLLIAIAGLFWLLSIQASADAIRPAYLEIRELAEHHYELIWKLPAKGDRTLRIAPELPRNCRVQGREAPAWRAGAVIERQRLLCVDGLVGREIAIDGLERLQNDVLVRFSLADGSDQTLRLEADNPRFTISARPALSQVALTYLVLGVEHILAGIDHLLFVLALVMIVTGLRRLFWTITAFTLAHSITLAGATLNWFWLPSAPVEAIIALSILLLAVEIVHREQGRVGATERWPWLVAFLFGLLHGFGFAGALQEVGLPAQAIPAALLFFNVGVELGQLIFVCAVLALGLLCRRLPVAKYGAGLLAYGIGSVGAFWTIERVAAFWS